MASLSELMAAAEQADSDYRAAVVGAANARADYELEFHSALAECEETITSVSARRVFAEVKANPKHRAWLRAEAQEKAARTHVQVLLGLMVAAQSQQKFAGKLDGGGMNADYGNDEW